MRLQRIDYVLASCRAHLDSTASRSTEMEAYLVGYLLVIICSAYEQRIKDLVIARSKHSKDVDLTSFVTGVSARVVRSIKCSEVAGVLGLFGSHCKEKFQQDVNDTPAQVAYDNIINNRHMVTHGGGTNMTFADVEREYRKSRLVLDAMGSALGLSPDDLAAFT